MQPRPARPGVVPLHGEPTAGSEGQTAPLPRLGRAILTGGPSSAWMGSQPPAIQARPFDGRRLAAPCRLGLSASQRPVGFHGEACQRSAMPTETRHRRRRGVVRRRHGLRPRATTRHELDSREAPTLWIVHAVERPCRGSSMPWSVHAVERPRRGASTPWCVHGAPMERPWTKTRHRRPSPATAAAARQASAEHPKAQRERPRRPPRPPPPAARRRQPTAPALAKAARAGSGRPLSETRSVAVRAAAPAAAAPAGALVVGTVVLRVLRRPLPPCVRGDRQ
jgi:hypothetical protein